MPDEPGPIELDADQVLALESSFSWMLDAKAALGAAYLSFEEAEFELAKVARHAREAEKQHAQVLRIIGAMKDLPSGEWCYDSGRKCLVRKEARHA